MTKVSPDPDPDPDELSQESAKHLAYLVSNYGVSWKHISNYINFANNCEGVFLQILKLYIDRTQ